MGNLERKSEHFYYVCYDIFKKIVQNNARIFFYIIVAFQYFAISLTASNSAIFYLTRGISIDWLAYLGTISAFTIVVFEFPTGLIADRLGSAESIILSMAFRGVASLSVIVCYGPAMFCIITVTASIGSTLYSGAGEAWIFSKDKSIKEDITVFFSNLSIATGGARIAGGLLGALIASAAPEIPFVWSGLILILLSIVFIFFEIGTTKAESRERVKEKKSLLYILINDAKDSVVLMYSNKCLFFMTLSCVFFIAFCTVPLIYWQPFFHETTGAVSSLGFIWAGFIAMNILGSSSLKLSIVKRKQAPNLYCCLILFCGVSIFLSAFLKDSMQWSIAAFLIYQFFLGAIGPVRGKLINEEIIDTKRASILSFLSFCESIGSMAGLSLFGYLCRIAGLKFIFIVSTVPLLVSFLSAVMLIILKNKKENYVV
jgi:MFS family permease